VQVFHSQTIEIYNCHYVEIQDLDIRRSFIGINVEGGSGNVTIRNNSLRDILSIGIYLNGNGATSANNVVENNTLTRTGNDALYTLMGSGNTFRRNTISVVTNQILGIPTVGDQCGIGLQQSTNTMVEHNSISNVHRSCFDYYYETGSTVRYNFCNQPGTHGAAPHGTGLSVYYNIFDLGGHGSGINAVNTGSSPDLIYNNTFYATGGYALMGGDSVSNGGTGAIIFRNNVVQGTSWYLMRRGDGLDEAGINLSSDYNLFYTTGPQLYSNLGISYSSFTDYQTASGQDAHSIFAAPQFVLTPPTLVAGFLSGIRAANFRLQSTSSGTRAGQNLQSAGFVGLTDQYVDYAGNPIPSGSQPNMGAFQ
jgi:parallel beta-helix repeat protein